MIQLQVLNRILRSGDLSMVTLNNLNEDYFSDYKNEFRFILEHYQKYGNVCDLATFVDKFKNFDVIEVNESDSYLLATLEDDYNTRRLAEIFNRIKTLLLSDKVDEAMSLYRTSQETLKSGSAITSVDLLKDVSRYDAYVDRTKQLDKYYVSTGFRELDAIIGGFDREEELATIVARTNYGKSWILLKCASAACAQGLNVGIYSGEMSERKVGYRLDTLIGHISNGALVHGNESVMNEYRAYIEALPTMFKGSIKVITPNTIAGPADVNALRAFIEKEHLDILFIDQLSLLEDARRGKTPVEKMSNISKDLKLLQVMKRIPIISVSQQNRTTTESGNVDTTQIAQSDRIGQDSTLIVFIEKDNDIMKLTLVKSRDTANGNVLTYKVDLNKGEFVFIPNEDDGVSVQSEQLESRYGVEGEDCF